MTPFHHRASVCEDFSLEQDPASAGTQKLAITAVDPPMEVLPGRKYPKQMQAPGKASDCTILSPLPPTLSPHPQIQDTEGLEIAVSLPVYHELPPGPKPPEPSDTTLYAAPLATGKEGTGWWRDFVVPMAEGTEFRPPELHADRAEVKVQAATEGIALKSSLASSSTAASWCGGRCGTRTSPGMGLPCTGGHQRRGRRMKTRREDEQNTQVRRDFSQGTSHPVESR
ncbi:mediator of RNA polymerase II transcription subunit 13-like [Erpetoichthys calabaricus]|uniref:mediator of RNA polymerase II transcription subunit 13-like n=1 Tax=Erpetoichthys calabaricus TaxID=27687 RepID=UPI0022348723|nr:mediator of RNA polymerase II transcription subunit 13-like [Erpetoichthys calabaricus]